VRRFSLALTALLLSTSVLTACQTTTTTDTEGEDETTAASPAGEGEGLKIGVLLPATGDLSSIGQGMIDVVPQLVEQVNACGGVNDADVEVVTEDSQTDPAAAVEAITKLTEVDQVAGVVGAFGSSISNAALDVAVRNEVMMISPGSTSTVFNERAASGELNGYWARTASPDNYQAEALAQVAMDEGYENIATAVINNDYGVGFEKEFTDSFKEMGGTVKNEEKPVRHDPKATTFETEASAAFGDEPDAVVGVLYVESGALFLKSAYQQGYQDIPVLLTDGVYSDDFPEKVGEDEDGNSIIAGALGTTVGAGGPGLEGLKTTLEGEVGPYVPQTWDAAALLMLAAEAANENSGPGIKEHLREIANAPGEEVTDVCEALQMIRDGEEVNFQGTSSKIEIDELGNTAGIYDIWTVTEDGSIEVVKQISVEADASEKPSDEKMSEEEETSTEKEDSATDSETEATTEESDEAMEETETPEE
ncbi:MAG: ABC transporter substrate-binding protein, partial [Kamptonema sp. SIO4C4]|nr:ABC transporter substrate-binding protein [Kamptonema sp. SIO4C4]